MLLYHECDGRCLIKLSDDMLPAWILFDDAFIFYLHITKLAIYEIN